MGENSTIEWTDHTFNPWIGCVKVAAGCTHCYAEAMAKRTGKAKWGADGTRVKTSEDYWRQPLKWNTQAERDGIRRRVFCASMADVFEDWTNSVRGHKGGYLHKGEAWKSDQKFVELADIAIGRSRITLDDLRRELFALIDATPWLDWLLLTKRPENIPRMWPDKADRRPIFPGMPGKLGEPLPCVVKGAYRGNVWLGTSVAGQDDADKNVPELLTCRDLAPVLFLSAEPLIGAVDLTSLTDPTEESWEWAYRHWNALTGLCWCDCLDRIEPSGTGPLDWVIVGGESGAGARPCGVHFIRGIVDQCKAAGVPCFVKQMGSRPYDTGYQPAGGWWPAQKAYSTDSLDGQEVCFRKLKDKKGGNITEFPEDLRVRQFPQSSPNPTP